MATIDSERPPSPLSAASIGTDSDIEVLNDGAPVPVRPAKATQDKGKSKQRAAADSGSETERESNHNAVMKILARGLNTLGVSRKDEIILHRKTVELEAKKEAREQEAHLARMGIEDRRARIAEVIQIRDWLATEDPFLVQEAQRLRATHIAADEALARSTPQARLATPQAHSPIAERPISREGRSSTPQAAPTLAQTLAEAPGSATSDVSGAEHAHLPGESNANNQPPSSGDPGPSSTAHMLRTAGIPEGEIDLLLSSSKDVGH